MCTFFLLVFMCMCIFILQRFPFSSLCALCNLTYTAYIVSFLIGNLDERVSEKVLYEIMIQAGRLVDLHMPRDKETNKHKGYAFAEYESPEIADYAIRLFSGLVRLYNRPARFAVCPFFL